MPADSPTSTSTPLPDPIRRFLAEARYASLATIATDGSPHQAIVWYALVGDDVLINSRRGRHWPGNLERDGRISLAVMDAELPTHWVGIKGVASEVRRGAAAVADIQAMARRYGKDPATYAGQDRVTFRVVVESTFEYGD
jgi:PPOX class probable F420-dependent enzyme